MKKILFILSAIVIFMNIPIIAQSNYIGNWQGSLKIQAISLRLVFKISEDSTGNLKAILNSPDQTDQDIPVDEVILHGDSIRLNLKMLKGSFDGSLANDTTLKGIWSQGAMSLPLEMYRKDSLKLNMRSQNPKKPYPYKEEEVTFVNKSAGDTLAGTLTYPLEGSKFLAVILISGSGPQDRDEALLGHKPFLVLSDYLTRNGIAVLRYDDRGVGKSTGSFKLATSFDFSTDTEAAVDFLKTRKEVDAKKIGLIGHSEGGLIAPIIASNRKDVAFIVLMAGTGVNGLKILEVQTEKIARAEGMSDSEVKQTLSMNNQMFQILSTEKDSAKASEKIKVVVNKFYDELSDSLKKDPQYSKEMLMGQTTALFSPWFKTFLTLDPAVYLQKTKVPVLALNGEKDLQVDPKQNLPAIERALKKGGNKHYKIVELKNMNHLFQNCETGAPSEYNKIDETINPVALKTISDWILQQAKR